MRVSVKKQDPGYVPDPQNYEVFLDGEKLLNCHTADEEKGIAYCYCDCCSETVEVSGQVQIRALPFSSRS